MSNDDEKMVKIHVTLDGCHVAGETLWALPVEGEPELFEINNIPYFVYGIHLHDVVRCTKELGPYPRYEVLEVLRPSGWHTLRLMFHGGADLEAMRKVVERLVEMGGQTELGYPGFVSLAVPPDKDLEVFVNFLDEFQEADMLSFETAETKVEGSFCGLPDDEPTNA
jgi:hypothetical protein